MAHKNHLREPLHLFEQSVSLSTLVGPSDRPDHGRRERRDGDDDGHDERHRPCDGGTGGEDRGREKRPRPERSMRSDQRTSQPSALVTAAVLGTAEGALTRNMLFPLSETSGGDGRDEEEQAEGESPRLSPISAISAADAPQVTPMTTSLSHWFKERLMPAFLGHVVLLLPELLV